MINDHRSQHKTTVITGLAHRTGYQLAYISAHHSYNLVLVDKDQEKLALIAEQFIQKLGIYIKTLVIDLSISTSPEEIFNDLQ
jgi:short-subunit dehydrogenase